MIDHNTLSLIKPKRLYDDKDCIIKDGIIEIEFGATKIIAPFVSKLLAIKIKVKDLWSVNLDGAEPFSGNISKLPNFEIWNEIPISVADSTVFSSISSVGEDTFYIGEISSGFSQRLDIEAIGLTWLSRYTSPKVISGTRGFTVKFDWYIFYYLFQMFKDLTGKKIGTLLWKEDANTIYFTNVDKEYFIVCSKTNPILNFKSKFRADIIKYFNSDSVTKSHDVLKKLLQETAGSEAKHLLRPFGDIVTITEQDHFMKYGSNNYTLYVTKEKK
jgi:hypothetical protein